jgi:hypothetical protein
MRRRGLTEGRVVGGSMLGIIVFGIGFLLVKLAIIMFVLWLLYKLVMHITGG